MSTALQLVTIVLLLYLAAVAYLYVFQRRHLYFPEGRDGRTPAAYGIAYEEETFDSGGVALSGWWIPQQERTADTVSLLYCHGNAANLSKLAHVAGIFHSYGFDTLMFEYRSYGASASAPMSEAGFLSDARAALRLLREKRPGQKVVVWGHSLGAAVASHLAHVEAVNGLILENPLPSIASMVRHRYPLVPLVRRFLFDKLDTVRYVQSRFGAPLLQVQGDLDEVIPPRLAMEVYSSAPGPKELLPVPGAGHNDFPDFHEDYKDSLLSWVSRAVVGLGDSSNDSTSRNASADRSESLER